MYELLALIKKPAKVKPAEPERKPDPKIYENIKTFEDAFQIAKGHFKIKKLPDFSSMLSEEMAKGLLAFTKLQIITWAINNDNPEVAEWIPDYVNQNQNKWCVLYRQMGEDFLPVHPQNFTIHASGGAGARLVFKDERRSAHADKYFRNLYKELYTNESQPPIITAKNG